jgi:hypothetical protein
MAQSRTKQVLFKAYFLPPGAAANIAKTAINRDCEWSFVDGLNLWQTSIRH